MPPASCSSGCGPSPAPTGGRRTKRRSPASTRSTSPSRSRRRRSTPRHGGFGDAPKFPRPSELLFLLREHARRAALGRPDPSLVAHGDQTLRGMALGGMRDHVGGGFHRYSVDAEWRVPHFEKMLYDQAQLVLAYVEAAQATGDAFYMAVAEDTLEYVLRDLTDPEGGFYSAEDADSVPPEHAADPGATKTEGAFYIWSDDEIGAALGSDAGDRPAPLWDSRRRQRAAGSARGVSRQEHPLRRRDRAGALGGSTAEALDAALARVRAGLLAARASRPRPHLDDKILTAWNGLMIAAFARTARALAGRPAAARYRAAAQRAAMFLRTHLWDAGTGSLRRRYRGGDAAIDGYAEDYACLIFGLLELFQADGDPEWLEWAEALQARQDELFWDAGQAGWFSTTGRDASVLLRLKEEYDGAEPAAGSVSVSNLITIGHLIGDAAALEKAERTLARFGPRIGSAARVIPMMLAGLSAWHADHTQIVIAGAPDAAGTQALAAVVARRYLPFAAVVPLPEGAARARLASRLPYVASMTERDGRAAAYVCRAFVCQEPVSDPARLAAALQVPAAP